MLLFQSHSRSFVRQQYMHVRPYNKKTPVHVDV